MQQIHDGTLGGHSGYLKSLHRVQRDFYWPGLRADVKKYVRECDTCQRLKHETCSPASLLIVTTFTYTREALGSYEHEFYLGSSKISDEGCGFSGCGKVY